MINKNSPYNLDEPLFQRNQFYGTNFTWYVVDSVESVAIFKSGYYPIPKDVFRNKSEYLKVDTFMENLPRICNSSLSPKYKKYNSFRNRLEGVNYSCSLLEAKQGLYSFDEQSNWTNKYDLVSLLISEIKLKDLPTNIQEFLNQFKIENLRFKEIEEINILDYFECDLTPER